MDTKSRLIVVRAGDSSLHPFWLNAEPDRRWHLHISYFGKRGEPYDLPRGVTLSRDAGQKWIGITACLKENPHLLDYAHIAFPDDDLRIATGSWDGVFDLAERTGAKLTQPALDPRSFYWHDVTLRRAWLDYREVNFIELMSPVFAADFLRETMPMFLENVSSMGIDYLWSRSARDQGKLMIISDRDSVLHTRALGGGTQYTGINPIGELLDLYKKHDLKPWPGRSARGFKNGKVSGVPWILLNRPELKPRIFEQFKKMMGLRVIG